VPYLCYYLVVFMYSVESRFVCYVVEACAPVVVCVMVVQPVLVVLVPYFVLFECFVGIISTCF
jgi:hypothetical protein